ncbi:MAG: chitin synthase [Pirellulaceae bacterium]|nr:chitin synthase [Pirellulaceae bacterium]
MSQISVRPFPSAKLALALFVFVLPATAWAQFNWGNTRAVGGIVIDSDGAVRQPLPAERQEILAQLRAQPDRVPAELKVNTTFRKVSLRALEAALAEAASKGADLPDGVLFAGRCVVPGGPAASPVHPRLPGAE